MKCQLSNIMCDVCLDLACCLYMNTRLITSPRLRALGSGAFNAALPNRCEVTNLECGIFKSVLAWTSEYCQRQLK